MAEICNYPVKNKLEWNVTYDYFPKSRHLPIK